MRSRRSWRHVEQAVALAPEIADNWEALAEVHYRRGDRNRAVESMRRCRALEPGRADFRGRLVFFETGDEDAARRTASDVTLEFSFLVREWRFEIE